MTAEADAIVRLETDIDILRVGLLAVIAQESHGECQPCAAWAFNIMYREADHYDVSGRCEHGQRLQRAINAALDLISPEDLEKVI